METLHGVCTKIFNPSSFTLLKKHLMVCCKVIGGSREHLETVVPQGTQSCNKYSTTLALVCHRIEWEKWLMHWVAGEKDCASCGCPRCHPPDCKYLRGSWNHSMYPWSANHVLWLIVHGFWPFETSRRMWIQTDFVGTGFRWGLTLGDALPCPGQLVYWFKASSQKISQFVQVWNLSEQVWPPACPHNFTSCQTFMSIVVLGIMETFETPNFFYSKEHRLDLGQINQFPCRVGLHEQYNRRRPARLYRLWPCRSLIWANRMPTGEVFFVNEVSQQPVHGHSAWYYWTESTQTTKTRGKQPE